MEHYLATAQMISIQEVLPKAPAAERDALMRDILAAKTPEEVHLISEAAKAC